MYDDFQTTDSKTLQKISYPVSSDHGLGNSTVSGNSPGVSQSFIHEGIPRKSGFK